MMEVSGFERSRSQIGGLQDRAARAVPGAVQDYTWVSSRIGNDTVAP